MLMRAMKHRNLRAPFALNHGLPLGGLVGESKAHILRRLRHPAILELYPILPDTADKRLARLTQFMQYKGWSWPLILKPNAGERGNGVQVIRSAEQAHAYLRDHPEPLIVQEFADLPAEVGVFIMLHVTVAPRAFFHNPKIAAGGWR